ncbi:MAG TPA: putative PEP-binding protein [Polyangiales bacterium]|nr:putative PEP-binding protein [Polyangiales bacterium]
MRLVEHRRDIHGYSSRHQLCEVPSNMILTDEFATIFDGFSIGSNDLTLDERSPA